MSKLEKTKDEDAFFQKKIRDYCRDRSPDIYAEWFPSKSIKIIYENDEFQISNQTLIDKYKNIAESYKSPNTQQYNRIIRYPKCELVE